MRLDTGSVVVTDETIEPWKTFVDFFMWDTDLYPLLNEIEVQ